MASRLLQRLAGQGVAIYDRTTVTKLHPTSRRVVLEIANGTRITADHAIVAAGYASQQWIPQRVAANRSSYAFISDPLDDGSLGCIEDTLVWETARPYLYMRSTEDGRLLVGGEDDRVDIPQRRDRRVDSKARTLVKTWARRCRDFRRSFPHSRGPARSPRRRTACRSSARTRHSARACNSRWPTAATASRTRRWAVGCCVRMWNGVRIRSSACSGSSAWARLFAHEITQTHPRRLRPRPRRTRTQPQGHRRRRAARCARRVLRRIRFRQVVARLRHFVRRSAAALFRVGQSVCAAPDRPGRHSRRRQHRRPAARGRLAAAARHAERAFVGGQRHDVVEPRAHAVFARRRLSGEAADVVRGGFLAEHRAGRVPDVPRPRQRLCGDRSVDGARSLAHHPREGDRRVAACMARAEPARHPGHARLRRRHPVARSAEEGSRLDPLHRRAAGGAGVSRLHAEGNARRGAPQGRARVHGHLHGRAQVRAAYVRDDAERDDEEARRALHGRQRVPGVRRQAPEARSLVGEVRRARHRASSRAVASHRMAEVLRPAVKGARSSPGRKAHRGAAARRKTWSHRIGDRLQALGLGYLAMDRTTPTLSPGELQRLRLATQIRSHLFGVVYVLDEPSAGLHPADSEALLQGARSVARGRQHDLHRRARSRHDAARGLARGCRARMRGSTAGTFSTAVRPKAWRRSRPRIRGAICSAKRCRCIANAARRSNGSNSRMSRATTCTRSTRASRWACSPPSRGFPARANRAW